MYNGYLANHRHTFGPRTKLAMCITLFNEEEEELRRTLEGVAQNLIDLQVGQDEVVVCLVADGRVNVTESLIDFASSYVPHCVSLASIHSLIVPLSALEHIQVKHHEQRRTTRCWNRNCCRKALD